MSDITKKIEEILLNDGLQYQADEEVLIETEDMMKKKEEKDISFKESYLRNDISFKESYLRNDFDNKS